MMNATRHGLPFAMGAAVVLLTGCAARQNMNNIGMAAAQPPTGQVAAAPGQQPPAAVPYGLTAYCSGPYITFDLRNQGSAPMEVNREHFALVVPGKGRKVIPYSNSGSVMIDLPKTQLAPNESIQGRAYFKEAPTPAGMRLVYKPDATGTYAEIARPQGA